MPTAEQVANLLAYDFLKKGNFAASGPVEVPSLRARAVAVAEREDARDIDGDIRGFEGLSVQSVGFEDGVENPGVHVYLTRGSVRAMKSLPQAIANVPVTAHKMGAISVRPDAAAAAAMSGKLFERNNRICCGSSCAPTSEKCAGTIGALVRRTNGGNQLYLLSNNHVLGGCNHVPRNQPILSPASMDGSAIMRAPGEVARHEYIHELRSGDPNFVNPCDSDLALARVTNPAILSSWQGDDANGYDTPAQSSAPASFMRVKKFGRTTGLTVGEIEAKVTAPMPVNYTARHFKGVVWFKDVWTVRAENSGYFALPGDSGSLVVDENGENSIGIVFAANTAGDYAWIVPMPCAIAAFNGLQLVSNHGV